jgi:anti-sigma regulatory factor (Ser/Thr protein kinase)
LIDATHLQNEDALYKCHRSFIQYLTKTLIAIFALSPASSSLANVSCREYNCKAARTFVAGGSALPLGSSSPISIECTAVSLILPVGAAVPLGLIVNELITNAVKYAFPDGRKGTIRVSLSEFGTRLRLSVRDDGVGLRAPVQGTGLGFHLVEALAKQLGSSVDIKSRERGTLISMTFDIPPGTGRSREKGKEQLAYCRDGACCEKSYVVVASRLLAPGDVGVSRCRPPQPG